MAEHSDSEVIEYGSWEVDGCDEHGVIIEFSHLSADGVETFSTTMQAENALEFAQAVIDLANEWLERNGGSGS